MLRTISPSVSSDIDDAVQGLLREDFDYNRTEHRTAHRDSLVRCVLIERGSNQQAIEAFSRDISNAGIGVVTTEPLPERLTATITIERLDGTTLRILADCRWCKRYGKKWFLSGWQFLNLR